MLSRDAGADDDIGAAGATALASALQVNVRLSTLHVTGACPVMRGVRILSSAMNVTRCADNVIGAAGATALASGLQVSHVIMAGGKLRSDEADHGGCGHVPVT